MEESSSDKSLPAPATPPPLPILRIDAPHALPYGRLGIHLAPPPLSLRLCAHGSWIVPIVTFLGATVFSLVGSLRMSAGEVLPWVIRGAVVAAMAMGVIALVRNRSHRRRGIFASAGVGLAINSVWAVGLVAFMLIARQELAVITANHQSLILSASSQQHYDQSVIRESHWLGDGALHSARIKFRGFPDSSPLAKDLAANFTRSISFALIYVDSSASVQQTSIDSADISLQYSDGTSVKAINPSGILMSAQKNRLAWFAAFRSPLIFPAGSKTPRWAPVFFPGGTDFSRVTSVVVPADGQIITFPGRFYTTAELTAPLAKALWTGRTTWQGAVITAAARKASQFTAGDPYRRDLRGDVWVVSITANASGVDHAVTLDTSATIATTTDNRIVKPVGLDQVLDAAQPGAADIEAHVVKPLVVQAKSRADRSVIVIFPPETDFEHVSFLTVQLNGVELLLRHPTTNRAMNSGSTDTLSQLIAPTDKPTSSIGNHPTLVPGSNFSFTDPPPGK
jgi:hypothetical protein